MKLFSALSLILLLGLSSCQYFSGEKIYGDGNITTQQRNVSSFKSIEVSGALKVHLLQGSEAVKVTADRNLQEYIDIFTEGEVLVIRNRGRVNLDPTKEIEIYVSAPTFKTIDVSGASEVIGDSPITGSQEMEILASGASNVDLDLSVTKLTIDISGACQVQLRGRANEVFAEASGASEIDALNFIAEKADIDLSGASNADFTVNTEMKVNASGASSVAYKGNAAVVQHVSGAGSVKKIN